MAVILWRRVWDSNPRVREDKRFSRPPRYDHFDNPPSNNNIKFSKMHASLLPGDSRAHNFGSEPFRKHSQNVRLGTLGFIFPCFRESLSKTTHRVLFAALTRYDHFDNPPGIKL